MDKIKALLLNHAEKIVAGITALIALMAVTSANWSSEFGGRSPLELQDMTEKGKAQIEQNIWPDEDKVQFAEIPDVENMVRNSANILTKAEDFEIGKFNPSILRLKDKRRAVAILAPESPKADYVVFPLAMPPEDEEETEDGMEEGKEGDSKSEEDLDEDERFAKLLEERFGQRSGGGPGGAGGYPGGGPGGPEGYAGGPGTAGGYPGGPGGAGALGGPEGLGAGGYGAEGYGGQMGSAGYEGSYGAGELYGTYGSQMMSVKKNIRVSAGISVRMVIDLQKQRNIVRDALHLPADYRAAQQQIQYVDLMVERRQKLGEPDSWGDWEAVSSEDLGEILKDSFGIDQDIVSPAVTRNTITMPLPRRAAGKWQPNEASHPRLEDFELSDEEKALIDKFNQRVTENLAVQEAERPVEVEQKGFSNFVQNATDVGSMYGMGAMGYGSGGYEGGGGGNYESTYDYDAFASSLGDGRTLSAEERELLDSTKATADHRLLLVRFMDFTVERGFKYQYRVRLEMKNPNYNHALDELEDPALSIEPTLFSEWSEPTSEVFLPMGHRLYLTEVDGRSASAEKVTVSIYTDTTDTGLPVMGSVRTMMGLPIAGKQSVEVVDLTSEEVALREVSLRTNDVLCAAEETERISSTDHEELRSIIDKTRGRVAPHQICVIDGDGGLRLQAVGENAKQEQMDRAYADGILKVYDAWKKKNQPTNDFFGGGAEGGSYGSGSELGMGYGASAAGGYYGGGGAESAKGSSRSSRRSRSGRSAAGGSP